ncbi:MAG: ATP-dependent Clp protease ATP-binding subunit ClpA, partial [Mariprofundaceae bacterium]|nr:ATP-dependent Clp protease ATP-binding subunit ClpA [Mariprofundaceae bacterium]
MTSNAGAFEMQQNSIGFNPESNQGRDEEAIKHLFSPEFRNRLDAVIPFASLKKDTVLHVAEKFLVELDMQLQDKKVELDVSDEAKAWLATHGYDEHMGARPMGRLIQNKIKKSLADAILFGDLQKGGVAHVVVVDDDIAIEFLSTVEAS